MDITRDKISRQSKPIQSNTVCTVIYRRRSSVHPRRPGRFLCADFSKPPNQHGVPYRVVNFLISLGVWCGGACAGQCGNEEFEKALAEIQPVLNGLKCSSASYVIWILARAIEYIINWAGKMLCKPRRSADSLNGRCAKIRQRGQSQIELKHIPFTLAGQTSNRSSLATKFSPTRKPARIEFIFSPVLL